MRNCKTCKSDINALPEGVEHCSEKCAVIWYRRLSTGTNKTVIGGSCLVCDYCWKDFNSESPAARFCSKDCKTEWHKREKREKNKQRHKEEPNTCVQCKTEFIPRRRHDERFCSDSCKIEFHSDADKIRRAETRANTLRVCPICDTSFSPQKSMKEIYCSANCRKTIGRKVYKMMSSVYRQTETSKADRSHDVLGYSPNDLLLHLQSFQNWDILKNGTWHLDHKFPIVAFVRRGLKDPKLICCLENLQPLSGPENCSKNDDYDKAEFEKWLEVKCSGMLIT